jgi:hypothetical protein
MNHQYQEKLAAKKVAEINLELYKNKVEVVSIKNNLKSLEEKIKEFDETQLSKEQLKLNNMSEEQQQIQENLEEFKRINSLKIFNIINSNNQISIQELSTEKSEQNKLESKFKKEWNLVYFDLQNSKIKLNNFINQQINPNKIKKETLEEYGLLNLEHPEKLFEERSKQWGVEKQKYYMRFAPSKKLWGIHPYYRGEKLESMIENRDNIDKHAHEIVKIYHRLLDNLNEISNKIDEIDKDLNEHNTTLDLLEIEYKEKKNELIKMKNENNKIEDKVLQAQNNVNVVSFEIKVDEVNKNIETLKNSIIEFQRNKNYILENKRYMEEIKPYWHDIIYANAILINKEEEIWEHGNKSRELKIIQNNYGILHNNINRYRSETPLSTRRGYQKQISYFTDLDIRKIEIFNDKIIVNKNYKEYTKNTINENDNGMKLFCTLIEKYDIDYTQILTDINRLKELETLIEPQKKICLSLRNDKKDLDVIKNDFIEQIKNIESEIIPKIVNELEDAKTLWELEKAYLDFEKASNELDNIK